MEAAAALGLSRVQTYRDVVAPQLFPVILPATANLFVDLLKDSAIIGVVGIEDLMRSADRLAKFHFHPFEFFTAASALYAAVVLLFSRTVARRLELRYAPRMARR
jgi:ABC-type amino acid transport system permease subunit